MRFSVLVDFVCDFAVLDEIFFGFAQPRPQGLLLDDFKMADRLAVSNIPQCPPH